MPTFRAAAVAALCLSGTAFADLDLAWKGMVDKEAIRYSFDEAFAWDAAARDRTQFAFAGTLGFQDSDLVLLCIELQQDVTQDLVAYSATSFEAPGGDFERSLILSSLFTNYYDDTVASRSASMAAAFAMMTWEIMSENFDGDADVMIDRIDPSLGAVQFGEYSEAAGIQFAIMRDSLFIADDSSNLITYRNDQYQDFVGQVPAPGAAALLGLAGIMGRRRRRD